MSRYRNAVQIAVVFILLIDADVQCACDGLPSIQEPLGQNVSSFITLLCTIYLLKKIHLLNIVWNLNIKEVLKACIHAFLM